MNRVDPEVLKAELFAEIQELSESSKKKLNLIIGVQSDTERTIVRTVIKTEVKKVLKEIGGMKVSLENLKNNQTEISYQIADIKKVIGGINGKS